MSALAGALLAASMAVVPVGASSVLTVPGNFPTIQAAINAAASGDTVMVDPGTYFENIDFMGKLITVQSSQGPGVTTIDGGNAAPVVNFSNAETSGAVLQGFTLQHGNGTAAFSYEGGGVHINGASPTIVGNVITANSACGDGDGISARSSSAIIRDNTITGNSKVAGCSGDGGGGIYIVGAASAQVLHNTITNNSTDFGGGIDLFASGTPTLQNNTITNNTATTQGGGIYAVNQSDASIVQNVISGNTSPSGGGLYVLPPSGTRGPLLVNNTIAGNTANDSGVFLSGFDGQVALYNNIVTAASSQPAIDCDTTYSSNSPLIDHSDVFNSAGPAAQGSCTGMIPNNFNISADPAFTGARDYHLSPGSPAIDAGNNAAPSLPPTDLDGKPRISGSAVDQGAYEFQQPLVVTAAALPGAVEGALFTAVVANFTGGAGPYSASIAWGDGQSSAGTVGSGKSVSGGHSYAEEGSYTVTVTVTDSTGASASAGTTESVSDASLSLSGTSLSVHHKTNFTARVATLSDADPGGAAGDYSGQIDWGDGTTSACPSATCTISASGGAFAVNGTHNYVHHATFRVTVTISDAGGAGASAMTTILAT
ncbi:MAG TPA: right-handed parallel beta-helix repeat-containing protein [Candidatus Dormibacteraeota bacterium]|nr:right-handed parallel beta-helix repeat-containing protein [Candidatus Dormibacteraeota bacterium]